MMQEKRSVRPELEEVKNINSFQTGYVMERQKCKLPPSGKEEACNVQLWESRLQNVCDARHGTPWDDTKAFLASFEEVAEACQWPKREWVARLRPALRGDAKHVYGNLDVRGREDYEEVKAAILRMDALRMETRRRHFRHFSCQEIEDPRWLHYQLQELCHQWLKPERRSKEQILELLILEQFLASLPLDLQEWIRAKGPDSCFQAVTLVEDFLKSLKDESMDSFDVEQEILEEAKQSDDKGTKHGRDSSSPLLIERTGMYEHELMERQTIVKEESDGTSLMVEEVPIQSGPQTVFCEVIQESNRDVPALDKNIQPDLVDRQGGTTGNEAMAKIKSEETFGEAPQISDGIAIVKRVIEEESCMVGKQPVSERHDFSRLTEGLTNAIEPIATVDMKNKMPMFSKYSRRYRYMPEFDTVLIQEGHQESPESEEMFQHSGIYFGEYQRTVTGERRPKCRKYRSHDSSSPQVKEELNIVQIDEKGFGYQNPFGNNPRVQREDQPYQCLHCGKTFSQKDYLSKHEKIHIEPKPFQCLQCGKCFHYKRDLNRHQMTHMGEKPFQCSECGNRFGRKDSLAFHLKSHKR